jgi:hypothetical protein
MAADSRINELQAGGVPMAAPVAAPAPEPALAAAAAGADPSDPANTNNLLQLARRLHEEHVREGMEKRDALVAEGHAAAARVVSEAEQAQRQHLGALEQERVGLERQIEELRTFEREYRSKLKGYIEGQLRDLETTNALTTGSGGAAQQQPAAVTAGSSEQQYAAAPQAAQAYNGPQPSDYSAYPQPTDYPGFAGGN